MPLTKKPIGLLLQLILGLCLLSFSPIPMFANEIPHRILTDQAGRMVTVPVIPQRVVALAPSITEIIYALNCQDRLKGVTDYSNFPNDAHRLPHIGTYISLDIEKIVALDPDLCIAVKDGNPKEAISRLETLGIHVYAIDPRNLDQIITSVIEIGELMNATNEAGVLADHMRKRIRRIDEIISSVHTRPRVFFQIGSAPIVSAGSNSFIHELIEKSGGTNLAGNFKSYPRFSLEEVLSLSPDIIIITTMSQNQGGEDAKAQWEKWTQIPAVKNHHIFVVDSDLFDRPTPRMIDGLEVLVRLIHPELFLDGDIAR